MPLALGDLFASDSGLQWHPFGDDPEVGLNLKQLFKNERLCFTDRLYHRQDPNEVIPDAQVVSFGFDIGIDDLVIQKLPADWSPFDTPGVVIQKASEEAEAVVPLQRI